MDLSALTGKFHPLLVHLPIGFLLLAVVFIWMGVDSKAIKVSIGLGALAAIASVITGLLLADSEGYNADVQPHKWLGITLATVSVAMWFIPGRFLKHGSVLMAALILLTGHFGGTLTHGSLIGEPEADNLDVTQLDLNSAMFYDDGVEPILEARCYSCHGEEKQKGGLRLDDPAAINKGGKDGKIIVAGNPEESEIIKRIDLPLDDEDHMPPKEKKQLTDQEKRLISLWIASGSAFDKKITESIDKKQIDELMATATGELMLPEISPADQSVIKKLVEQNVAVAPVAKESNFLQVNFVSVPDEAARLLEELRPIAKNVMWLKLNDTKIEKIDLTGFVNLRELNVSGTNITDVEDIAKCPSLVKLNLSNTRLSSVDKLKALPNLRYLNIYHTSIDNLDLPGVKVEKGDYDVPTLETDTTEVKAN